MTQYTYSFTIEVPHKHLEEIAVYQKIGPALIAFGKALAEAGYPIEWTRTVADAPKTKRGRPAKAKPAISTSAE